MAKSVCYAGVISGLLAQLSSRSSAATTRLPPAFILGRGQSHRALVAPSPPLRLATVDDIPSDAAMDVADGSADPETLLRSRDRLLALSTTLASNSASGRFITRPADKVKLQRAINDLEGMSPSPPTERERDMLLGDWTLLATANLPSSDIRRRIDDKKKDGDSKSKGWFGKRRMGRTGLSLFGSEGRTLNPIQKAIRKTTEVTQRIRDDGSGASGGDIDRVDNVIEYTPLDTLEDIIPESSPLFGILGSVNVNPLKVKKSKVVLVHKAEVESVAPVLRTKIAWTSSVVNVAGTSQFLEPDGADVFGVNNLFGEFVSTGAFDTPYVDEDVRVSRTSGPIFEQLRVFVRKGSPVLDDEGMLDSLAAEMRVEEEREVADDEEGDVGAKVKKVVDSATTLAENARSAIEKDMEDVSKALGETMDDVVGKVQDAVEDDLEQIGKAVEEVQSAVQGEGGDVGDAISNVAEAVAKVPGDVRSIVEEDVSEVADEVEEVLETMVADVQDSVEADLKDIGKSIDEVREAVTGTEEEKKDDAEQE